LLIRRFLTIWEQPPGNELLLTLLRSAVTDDVSVDRMQQVFTDQVIPAVLRFGDQADATRRAGLIVTQLLGVALCRYVLRLPPVISMTPEQLITDIAPAIQRYLTTPPGGRPGTDHPSRRCSKPFAGSRRRRRP